MSKLSLLRLTDTRMMNSAAESDLLLDRLFSAHTLRVLRSATADDHGVTIRNRQEVFERMADPGFVMRMNALRDALVHLSKQLELLGNARVEFEQICLRLAGLKAYLAFAKALQALDGAAELFCRSNAALREDFPTSVQSSLRDDLSRSCDLLGKMHTSLFLLTESAEIADRGWLLNDRDEPSLATQLTALAEQMGIVLPISDCRPMKTDETLGAALLQLYATEAELLRQIMGRYDRLDLQAPSELLNELRFFFEIQALQKQAAEQGIPTCLPRISADKCYRATKVYDITLTLQSCPSIVPNPVDFSSDTPVQFLIGANGGGKTTYLRAVGVNLLLFLAGCPIFAESATIYPFSAVYTHFPVDESFTGLGRLDSEKLRIDRILEIADADSFFLLNETFSATDEEKGFRMALQTAEHLRARETFGLYVTHFLEIKNQDFPVLSAVVEGEGNRRTFQIRRQDGAASSYAVDILRKYGLDADSLAQRRRRDGN